MAKYPYYITLVEKDGRRDINLIKVMSPTNYIELSTGFLPAIVGHETSKGISTDSLFKEKSSDGQWKLIKKYILIPESIWNESFIQVVNRLAGENKYREIVSKNKSSDEELHNLFYSLNKVIDSTMESTKKAQQALLNKYKYKILDK